MNEADIKGKIVAQLKEDLPRACVIRHEDLIRKGIPDLSATYGGTSWLEVKYLRLNESQSKFREHFDLLQLATCRWLEAQGRCDYLVVYHLRKELYAAVISPKSVSVFLEWKILDVGNFITYAKVVAPFKQAVDSWVFSLKQGGS